MDPALQIEAAAQSHQKIVDKAILKGHSPVQMFYLNATVFLTGVTGFIGKQLLEKLIRTCKLKKVYVLMRTKKGMSIEERFSKMLADPIFDTLHQTNPKFVELIQPVEGDVASIELGTNEKDRELIRNEVDVIFHAAATVSFDEPIKSATMTNVRGTRELLHLAKMCHHLRTFVYISTAYSNATFSRRGSQVSEEFYLPPISPGLLIEMAETIHEDRLNEMKDAIIQDWPNTYAFTKALGEELVRTSNLKVPMSVVRPTIVISSWREPYPGWVDKNSVLGPNGIILGSSLGVLHALQTKYEIKIDFIPVDYVTNVAIAAAFYACYSNGMQDATINKNNISNDSYCDSRIRCDRTIRRNSSDFKINSKQSTRDDSMKECENSSFQTFNIENNTSDDINYIDSNLESINSNNSMIDDSNTCNSSNRRDSGSIEIINSKNSTSDDSNSCNSVNSCDSISNCDNITIYNIGTSNRNHLTWGGLAYILNNIVRRTVISSKAVWYCFVAETPRPWLANIYTFLYHSVPAVLVDSICWVIGQPQRLRKLYATVNKLGSVISFYTTNEWTFLDTNTLKLYQNLSKDDRLIYQCNIGDIEWKEMILLWCVGVRRYVIKDGLKDTNYGQKKQTFYRIMTYIMEMLFMYFVLWFAYKFVYILMFGFGF